MMRALLLVVGVSWLSACASAPTRERPSLSAENRSGSRLPATALICGALVQTDAFETLLVQAGIRRGDWPSCGPLSPAEALRLQRVLVATPTQMRAFPMRLVLAHLLSEVQAGRTAVPRTVLAERMERFRYLAVLRPDGYLAAALTGATIQRGGTLEARDGGLYARVFQLGRFYDTRLGTYREVDEHLQPRPASEPPLDDVSDDADVINRVLDGTEDAFVDVAMALSKLVLHPIQSLKDLSHLPEALVLLVRNSPAYFEHFRLMTRGEQIRALARLMTNVLLSTGGSGASASRIALNAGEWSTLTFPALQLAEDGSLAIELTAVPAGKMVTALSGGPGALFVLQMANQGAEAAEKWTPPHEGPGEWILKSEGKSAEARQYETQITGAPSEYVYRVKTEEVLGAKNDFVDFDGYKNRVLLEAKGTGYAKFLDGKGEFKQFYQGGEKMIKQAERQVRAANGVPIEWHFAEREVADWARGKFARHGNLLTVVYTPQAP